MRMIWLIQMNDWIDLNESHNWMNRFGGLEWLERRCMVDNIDSSDYWAATVLVPFKLVHINHINIQFRIK